jgi:hypothetical protein
LRELDRGTWRITSLPCACGEGDQQVEISARDARGLPLGLTLCGRCALLRTSPGLALAYEESPHASDWAALHDDAVDDDARRRAARERGREMLQALAEADIVPGRVFHVGCRDDALLAAFATAGHAVAGCHRFAEPTPAPTSANDDARAPAPARAILIRGDAGQLARIAGGPADLVITTSLELSVDVAAHAAELSRALCPGGHLLVDSCGIGRIDSQYGGDLLAYLEGGRRWFFAAPSLTHLLESVGLEVLYADDAGLAVARKPSEPSSGHGEPSRAGRAVEVLRYLADREKALVARPSKDAAAQATARASGGDAPGHRPCSEPARRAEPFFCIGCQKSGTTLLARVLDQHPLVACMAESYALIPDAGPSIMNPDSDKWKDHGFGRDSVERWAHLYRRELSDPKLNELMRLTGRCYPLISGFAHTMPEALDNFAARTGARVVGDKWPWYIDFLDVVREVFPRAKFIYSVRDPRGLWNSGQRFLERGRGTSIVREMLHKDQKLAPYIDQQSFLSVRYEDLVCDPAATAERLYRFLGVDFDPSYLEYDPERDPYPDRWSWIKEARDDFNPRHASKWRKQMTPEQIETVTRDSSWFLDKYGYAA